MRPVFAKLELVSAILCAACLCGCEPSRDPGERVAPPSAAAYVGNEACASCHGGELEAWNGSHHERAMQTADADTVLGDFAGAELSRSGVTSIFRRDGGDFVVTTRGRDGERSDYRVAYTFGVDPLQQYLLEMPDGRLQAFDVAWDTRPAEQGGQRWFQLQPGERIGPDDPLHWTRVLYNWNATCAECHSTNVVKSYDPDGDSYATTSSSVNVGCESCHGPGSSHAAAPGEVDMRLGGLARTWTFPEGGDIARRVPARAPGDEVEVCAACHSRRSQLTDDFEPGEPLLDGFRPALLTEGLYHADGQILDEVYVYGSFLQSAMYAAGVTCSDCHEPHGATLRAEGNALCGRCHLPETYDTPAHHRHAEGTPGARCVSCHMPAETYMVVDPRRDHSFRVPRPDLSATLGTPNACNGCHADESAEWAAEQVAAWYPDGRTGRFHYGEALHAGRNWTAERGRLLARVAGDAGQPAIVRATAVNLMAQQIDDAAIETIRGALEADEPLVQLAALEALAAVPVELRVDPGQRFLTRSALALRVAAAEALVPARNGLSVRRRADLEAAVDELRAVQRFNMDRPEGLLSRANLEAALGDAEAAEAALRTAIERHPGHTASYVNLADLYRRLGREIDGEQVLRRALELAPSEAALHHALGLALVRLGRPEEALAALRRARELDRDNPQYAYVYGVALNSLGGAAEALDTLRRAHQRFPGHGPTLVALATMHRDAGNVDQALRYARLLLEMSPAHPAGRALVDELE